MGIRVRAKCKLVAVKACLISIANNVISSTGAHSAAAAHRQVKQALRLALREGKSALAFGNAEGSSQKSRRLVVQSLYISYQNSCFIMLCCFLPPFRV